MLKTPLRDQETVVTYAKTSWPSISPSNSLGPRPLLLMLGSFSKSLYLIPIIYQLHLVCNLILIAMPYFIISSILVSAM